MAEGSERFEAACRFVIRLGTFAHRYGTQTMRLESYLIRVIRALGYDGFFKSTPTEMQFTFIEKNELWHKTHHIYMPGTGYDLAKLGKVGELVRDLENGAIPLEEANRKLEEINQMPPPYNRVLVAIGYAVSGAGFAGFLRCGTVDVILSALLSLVVYLIVALTEKVPDRFEHWVPFSCTFFTGALATLSSLLFPGLHVYLITLSTVIYLIPGFTISTGVMELTYKHVISGTVNIVNGMVYLVLLFAGAWVGISLVSNCITFTVFDESTVASYQMSWMSAIIMEVGLCIIFQTPKRDLLWAILASVLATLGIVFGDYLSGVNLGNFIGTVLAVIFANVWSDITDRAASLVLLPAIVFLVSGSVGFRGFVAMSTGNTELGEQQFIHMFVVAVTIAMGLIVGNSIFRPRISL